MSKSCLYVILVVSCLCTIGIAAAAADPPAFTPLSQTAEGTPASTNTVTMPGLYEGSAPAGPLGRLAIHDARTGEITYLDDIDLDDILPGTFRPGGDGVLPGPAAGSADKNFSAWTAVSDPSIGAYPRSVKLEICWDGPCSEPYGGGCSGTLIDPLHVITAAHCVYSWDEDHPGWAADIRVQPGRHELSEPFGHAHDELQMAWTGWYEDHDHHHDVAVIRLERPIGALVGWWGYGTDDNCDSYTGGVWTHRGYPGEELSNGRVMYENSGHFDDCWSDYGSDWHLAVFDSPSWGGSSGSGSMYGEVVWAILRGSDRETFTDASLITSGKFAGIEAWREEAIPTAPDLWPIYVQAEGSFCQPDLPLDALSFVLASYAEQGFNDNVICNIYLSDDATITTGDVWLGYVNVPVDVPAMSAQIVDVWPPPTIPLGTAPGRYFVGVILDYADAVLSNNITAAVELDSINVDCESPGTTSVPTPVDGATCQPLSVTLDWPGPPTIDIYQLRLGTLCGGNLAYEGHESQCTVTDLDYGTTYHTEIRMRKYCGAWGAWGVCHSFTTMDLPTCDIEFLAPSPGDICQDSTLVSIGWSPVPGADDYQLQVGESCGSGTVYNLDASTPHFDVTGLAGGTAYFYRVRVKGVCGNWGNWSPCREFSTLHGIYPVPDGPYPSDGNACVSPHVVLSWQPPVYPSSYEVEWGVDCRMDTTAVVSTPYILLPPLAEGTWYWHVRALHVCGGVSAYSPCWSFGVDGTPPLWPGYLESTTHETSTWSNDPVVTTIWEDADDDCTVEYRIVWDHLPTTEPDSLAQAIPDETHDSEPLPDGDDHWVHVLAKDVPGNLADETEHLGPFWIDATAPTIEVLNPVGGQHLVEDSLVTIAWTAVDPWSGVDDAELHYTIDAGATWVPIAAVSDPMVTTHDWTVPQALTDSARVRVTVTDVAGNSGSATNERWFTIGPPTGAEDIGVAARFVLAGGRPNPFNPSTTIRFAAPRPARVRLAIYDLQGRLVRVLSDGPVSGPAWYEVRWFGQDTAGRQVGAGVYFCRLEAPGFNDTTRLMLVR